MRKIIFVIALSMAVVGTQSNAQTRLEGHSANPASITEAKIENPFAGKWTYRSFHNRPEVIVGDDPKTAPKKAFELLFGEGVMTVNNTDTKMFKGAFDMGNGYLLDLEGTVRWQTYVSPTIFEFSGKGRSGTPTEGWQYDYVGYLAWMWPNGIGQVPAIVGTVIRAKPHAPAKAGYVASFVATKSP